MKKILLYTDTPQIGGAELQMFLLAKFLDKTKFTPILACSNYPALDKWCSNFEGEGIQVIRLEVKSKHDPKHLPLLKKILHEQEIDILHAHIWNPASCRFAYLAAKSTDVPLVTTEHDPFKISPMKNLFKKYSLRNVKKIIAISNDNKHLLAGLYPKHKGKIQVIHNGIDTTWWQSQLLRFSEEDQQEVREQIFHANHDSFVIISIAELHERKGQKYLIEAMKDVVAKYANVKLVIVGEGGERENLEKLVKKLGLEKHITLTGKKSEIPKLLKSSNLFVLPSRREGFGLVNLEAMYTPLAVVASKVGGIPDIINKDCGVLVPPEDSKALSENILSLIASPSTRKKMANAGRARVLEHFTAEKMAEEYGEMYEKIKKS